MISLSFILALKSPLKTDSTFGYSINTNPKFRDCQKLIKWEYVKPTTDKVIP